MVCFRTFSQGPDKSAVAYLGTMVESLSILDRVPDMLEVGKEETQMLPFGMNQLVKEVVF